MTSSLESTKPMSPAIDQNSSPRISFSAEFLDDKNFISITPTSPAPAREEKREKCRDGEFEFLSNKMSSHSMMSADELFFEGKLLPFWGMEHAEKLNKISLNSGKDVAGEEEPEPEKEQKRGNWFIDDDPSPRPPKCTVLWKELLRLKKQRASSLSPSSSTSSSSSSGSDSKEWLKNKEKQVKRVKKGLERTRSASLRIRPLVNVPICTQAKSAGAGGLPPLLSLKKVRTERSEQTR